MRSLKNFKLKKVKRAPKRHYKKVETIVSDVQNAGLKCTKCGGELFSKIHKEDTVFCMDCGYISGDE